MQIKKGRRYLIELPHKIMYDNDALTGHSLCEGVVLNCMEYGGFIKIHWPASGQRRWYRVGELVFVRTIPTNLRDFPVEDQT